MRRTISTNVMATVAAIIIMVSCGVGVAAQTVGAGQGSATEGESLTAGEGVRVSGGRIERSGEFLKVGMDLDLSDLSVTAGRAVLLTPLIATDTDSLDLPSVGVYGRTRYYFYVRNGRSMLTEGEKSYKAKDRPDSLSYSRTVELPAWAEGKPLQLSLRRSEYGCCGTLIGRTEAMVAAETVKTAGPVKTAECIPATVIPAETVRERSISGSAFIDYPVDRTDIREDYLSNVVELSQIRALLDSVKNDPDITVTQIWMKGYASPEGPYGHNAALAQARSESLKAFIQSLYGFGDGLIVTDFEPEDWAGLREYVDASALEHKAGILDLIDGGLEPDSRERAIRSAYPTEYRFLHENVYPQLRRTDYRISCIVRERAGSAIVGDSSGTTDQDSEKTE